MPHSEKSTAVASKVLYIHEIFKTNMCKKILKQNFEQATLIYMYTYILYEVVNKNTNTRRKKKNLPRTTVLKNLFV